jgi:flavocytochrome c
VTGVQIRQGYDFGQEDSGTTRNIRARRAVILATGGFGNDVRFRARQNPLLDESIESTNHRGAPAEGLLAAPRIDALPVHLSYIQTGPWGCPDETGYGRGARFASHSVYPAGILVDPATGTRIVSEWADRKQRSDAIFNVGHVCVGVPDSEGDEKDADSLERRLKRGQVRAFDNLVDLAAAYDMPRASLEATVHRYNGMIESGESDEFGNSLAQPRAQPVDESPFPAIRLWPKVHCTVAGVGIDSNARVIDLNHRPIPRLFAAGAVCGSTHGASRLGNCSLSEYIVFGRSAGQQAARLRPRD